MDFVPRQHTGTNRFAYRTVLGETQHRCDAATTLFSRNAPIFQTQKD